MRSRRSLRPTGKLVCHSWVCGVCGCVGAASLSSAVRLFQPIPPIPIMVKAGRLLVFAPNKSQPCDSTAICQNWMPCKPAVPRLFGRVLGKLKYDAVSNQPNKSLEVTRLTRHGGRFRSFGHDLCLLK